MGQKINPTGLRIGVIKDWESRWYADPKDFGDTLVEDHKLREFLLELLAPAGVPKIEIERNSKRVNINIFCAKPGMVIGKGGAEIEKLKNRDWLGELKHSQELALKGLENVAKLKDNKYLKEQMDTDTWKRFEKSMETLEERLEKME